jgi:hypothetical protein
MQLRLAAVYFSLVALLAGSLPPSARADAGFVAKDADVGGVKLHYTTGGHGPAVILLHGFAETSRMWQPILPVLGENLR